MDFGGAYSALSQIPIDWTIIGIFFIVVAADALRAGCVRAASLALSFPIAALLYQMLPQTILLSTLSSQFSNTLEQVILFGIIEIALFVCLHQMLYSFDPYTSFLSAAACGLAATVAVLSVWMQLPILQTLWHFDPLLQAVFGPAYRFLWLMGAYLVLAFVGS